MAVVVVDGYHDAEALGHRLAQIADKVDAITVWQAEINQSNVRLKIRLLKVRQFIPCLSEPVGNGHRNLRKNFLEHVAQPILSACVIFQNKPQLHLIVLMLLGCCSFNIAPSNGGVKAGQGPLRCGLLPLVYVR